MERRWTFVRTDIEVPKPLSSRTVIDPSLPVLKGLGHNRATFKRSLLAVVVRCAHVAGLNRW